jgi:uncharacterized protein
MPDIIASLPDGFPWLVLTVIVAGLVRGFSGFGTALITVPVAAQFLSPPEVVVMLNVMDIFGPMLLVPQALRNGEPREVARLCVGSAIGIPVGVWLLTQIEPTLFRWLASSIVLLLVVLLMSGWRYKSAPGAAMSAGIGGLSGLMGGFSGLSGPPIVLLYLGSSDRAERIRANIILFFTFGEIVALVTFWVKGLLTYEMIVLGLVLAVPYTVATLTGSALFKRHGDAHYRRIAYVVIALAAISGMPIFD